MDTHCVTPNTIPLARLTRQPESCYSQPVRIPVGSGFSAELPPLSSPGPTTVLRHWDAAAATIAALASIDRPGWVCFTRLDQRSYGWVECTLAHPTLSPTQLLTHPRLATALAEELQEVCDGPAAFYVRDERLQACPLPLAIDRPGWHGPFDLRTGYCVAFAFLRAGVGGRTP